jgi:hypothetical protein
MSETALAAIMVLIVTIPAFIGSAAFSIHVAVRVRLGRLEFRRRAGRALSQTGFLSLIHPAERRELREPDQIWVSNDIPDPWSERTLPAEDALEYFRMCRQRARDRAFLSVLVTFVGSAVLSVGLSQVIAILTSVGFTGSELPIFLWTLAAILALGLAGVAGTGDRFGFERWQKAADRFKGIAHGEQGASPLGPTTPVRSAGWFRGWVARFVDSI